MIAATSTMYSGGNGKYWDMATDLTKQSVDFASAISGMSKKYNVTENAAWNVVNDAAWTVHSSNGKSWLFTIRAWGLLRCHVYAGLTIKPISVSELRRTTRQSSQSTLSVLPIHSCRASPTWV